MERMTQELMKGIFKMVDKTIIDGIDVSKCNMFRDDVFTDKQLNNVCSIGLWQRDYSGLEEFCKMSCDCKSNPNCHFKQLARAKDKINYMEEYIKIVENARNDLEQEVEKWKYQAELGSDTADRLSKELEDKNQEIEKLKNQNEMLSKNNSVQQWCDMYNKKDKECYDVLLKLAKKEQECEELRNKLNSNIERMNEQNEKLRNE